MIIMLEKVRKDSSLIMKDLVQQRGTVNVHVWAWAFGGVFWACTLWTPWEALGSKTPIFQSPPFSRSHTVISLSVKVIKGNLFCTFLSLHTSSYDWRAWKRAVPIQRDRALQKNPSNGSALIDVHRFFQLCGYPAFSSVSLSDCVDTSWQTCVLMNVHPSCPCAVSKGQVCSRR